MPPGHAPTLSPLCRQCGAPVEGDPLSCPQCEAPRPARPGFSGEGYEWQTAARWLGSPLVHVAFGMDATGRPRTARGVVAIGQRAVGGLAIGLTAFGIISVGLVSLGLFSTGVVAVGALAACGVNAFAPWACGVVAVGWSAAGLAALRFTP